MKTKVQKWGNSLGLRIPKIFAREARIDDGSSIDIKIEGKKLVIKPLRSSFNLDALLAQVTVVYNILCKIEKWCILLIKENKMEAGRLPERRNTPGIRKV